MAYSKPLQQILNVFSQQNTILLREELTQALSQTIELIPDKQELGALLGQYTAEYENTQLNLFNISQDIFEQYIHALGYISYPSEDIYLPFINTYLDNTNAPIEQFKWILYLALNKKSLDLYHKILKTPKITTYQILALLIEDSTYEPNSFLDSATMVLDNIDITTIPKYEQYQILDLLTYGYNIHTEDTVATLTILFEKGFDPNVKNQDGLPLWFKLLAPDFDYNVHFATLTIFYMTQDIDLFMPISINSQIIPAIFYAIHRESPYSGVLRLLMEPLSKLPKERLYTKDSWGRNLLHIYLITIKRGLQYHQPVSYDQVQDLLAQLFLNFLIEGLGFDLDQPILINDQDKLTLAKIKHTLPSEYGKTGRQIVAECYNMIKKK